MTNKINKKSNTAMAAKDEPSTNDSVENVAANDVGTQARRRDADTAASDDAPEAAPCEASANERTGSVGIYLPKSRPARQRR
jgi:hypothetical protein